MADIKDRANYVLASHQRGNPILDVKFLTIPGVEIADEQLEMIFGKKRRGLKTWNGKGKDLHWLACRNGIPLHTDPGFNRYAYQMVVRNDGWALGGLENEASEIPPGAVYILDTHSPHELVRSVTCEGRWFAAVGFDSQCEKLDLMDVGRQLLEFAEKHADSQ